MHIEWSLLNEKGTMEAGGVRKSQSKGDIFFSWETNLLPTEGHRYWDQGDTIDFMEKDPVASLLWPWGLSWLLTEGQKVLKHFAEYTVSHGGGENKEKKQTNIKTSSTILLLFYFI